MARTSYTRRFAPAVFSPWFPKKKVSHPPYCDEFRRGESTCNSCMEAERKHWKNEQPANANDERKHYSAAVQERKDNLQKHYQTRITQLDIAVSVKKKEICDFTTMRDKFQQILQDYRTEEGYIRRSLLEHKQNQDHSPAVNGTDEEGNKMGQDKSDVQTKTLSGKEEKDEEKDKLESNKAKNMKRKRSLRKKGGQRRKKATKSTKKVKKQLRGR